MIKGMQRLLLLLFSLLLSFNSYGEWTKIVTYDDGNSTSLNIDSLQISEGYVYWWQLNDFAIPTGDYSSAAIYHQGDCNINRYKWLALTYYYGRMGTGKSDSKTPSNPEWEYPLPGSGISQMLDIVCGIFDQS